MTMEYPRTMDREGNPVQPDYLRNPPMIQYHPTNFDWVVYDIIPYSYNEYFLPSLYRKSPSEVVGAKEKEKNVGEIGNEGIKLCPNEPLARRRSLKRKTTSRGTVVQLSFSGCTTNPYKV